jgi:hypothetical protein
VIDELDRVGDTRGMASFLKAMSGSNLKFLLVGIAQSLSDLDLDHPSVERQLWPVNVPRMRKDELVEVVNRAIANLAELDLHYKFTSNALDRLIDAAFGFPWFVHVIGQSALVTNGKADYWTYIQEAIWSMSSDDEDQQSYLKSSGLVSP